MEPERCAMDDEKHPHPQRIGSNPSVTLGHELGRRACWLAFGLTHGAAGDMNVAPTSGVVWPPLAWGTARRRAEPMTCLERSLHTVHVEECSDAELLAAAGEGNGDAFGVLFRRHVRPITGYAIRRCDKRRRCGRPRLGHIHDRARGLSPLPPSDLEIRASAPAPRRSGRLGVPSTAMRALRAFAFHATHVTAVVALATVLMVGWTEPVGETAAVTINTQPEVPGYVMQYGTHVDTATVVERARNDGYEVSIRRIFTPEPRQNGRILDERHPGPITVEDARGPLLFVIGYTIGSGERTAN